MWDLVRSARPEGDARVPSPASRPWRLAMLACAGLLVGLTLSATSALMLRSSVSAQQRQSFTSAAANVTATLGTEVGSDLDFLTTLRGVMTMRPSLTPTGFDVWYRALDGRGRQAGGVGSAVVADVPASQLVAFERRRDRDPAFRQLLGAAPTPVARGPERHYCLTSLGTSMLPLSPLLRRLVQLDWCSSGNLVGLLQAPILASATSSGQPVIMAVDTSYMHTTFLELAFYRAGAPLQTLAERRRALAGWVVSTVDMRTLLADALGRDRGLSVSLFHVNPGHPKALVGTFGSLTRGTGYSREADLPLAGDWTVTVRGAPPGIGLGATTQALLALLAGTLVTILLVALGVVLARSRERALRLVEQRTAQLRHQALHDALTGLPNRRALIRDLEGTIANAAAGRDAILVLFDLDGFKEYNDTFGHVSGDALLARLGDRLGRAMVGLGSAYRMGGDEFCVLAEIDIERAGTIAHRAATALRESGEAFTIGCSYGIAALPIDASSAAEALRVADDRMYDHKGSRASAGRQSSAVLIRVLRERSPELGEHLSEVATLATVTARALGVSEPEVKRIELAAALHDVGTVAIPDSILYRPGPLDNEEWEFMRRHTVIGERIMNAAPSLAHASGLVRSSHERYDGSGYPDGLAGDRIPLGAAIIAVCDAFNAMTSDRPYRAATPVDAAVDELRRCAGSQFRPDVVDAFCRAISSADEIARRETPSLEGDQTALPR